MIDVEATCPVCNNALSSHEDGDHPPYVELGTGCFLCHRSDPIKHGTYVRVVWTDGSLQTICDDCYAKADEAAYLDEELDLNPEGDPTLERSLVMADKKFDLGDYVEVKDRIRIFYELFGGGRLVTDEVTILTDPANKQRVMVKALAYRTPDDPHPGVGYSWMELPGTTSYTKGSELENTETSAWGRAIASLGILIDHSIASGQEVQNKQDDGKGSKRATPAAAVDAKREVLDAYMASDLTGDQVKPIIDELDRRIGAAEARTTHRDGLIGKAIAQGTQDFQLRQGPDGPALPFRIKEGRLSQIAVAKGDIARALDTFRDTVLGQRVTVWGHYTDETFTKKDKDGDPVDFTYKVLHVERIATPDWILPAPATDSPLPVYSLTTMELPDEPEPIAEGQEALPFEPLTEDEKAAIAGSLP